MVSHSFGRFREDDGSRITGFVNSMPEAHQPVTGLDLLPHDGLGTAKHVQKVRGREGQQCNYELNVQT